MADQGKLTIEITTGHCLGGEGNDVYPGRVLEAPRDLSIADAWKKVRMGYARVIQNPPADAGSEPEKVFGPATVVTQDPAIESRDPVIDAPEAVSPPAHRARSHTGRR